MFQRCQGVQLSSEGFMGLLQSIRAVYGLAKGFMRWFNAFLGVEFSGSVRVILNVSRLEKFQRASGGFGKLAGPQGSGGLEFSVDFRGS